MKLITEERERSWYLVDEWETKAKLKAIVSKCVWSDDVKRLTRFLHDFYTGYVQVPDGVVPDEGELDVHGGITFSLGKRKGFGDFEGNWIGFDMAHLGDENIPQAEEYAREQCEKLALQISNLK